VGQRRRASSRLRPPPQIAHLNIPALGAVRDALGAGLLTPPSALTAGLLSPPRNGLSDAGAIAVHDVEPVAPDVALDSGDLISDATPMRFGSALDGTPAFLAAASFAETASGATAPVTANTSFMPATFQPADPGAELWQAANAFAVAAIRSGASAAPAPQAAVSPAATAVAAPQIFGSSLGPLVHPKPRAGDPVPEYITSPLIDLDHVAKGAESNIPSLFSPSGIRYAGGAVNIAFGDLASGGFGLDYGVTRTWTNLTNTATGFSGSGMLIDQLPHLRQDPNGTLTEVANGFNVRYFDQSGGVYTPRFFVQDTFTADSANHQYIQTDSAGNTFKYNDFTVTPANEQGVFKSFADANGNTIAVTSWTSDGKVGEIQRSNGSLIESYLYSYIPTGQTNAGLVSSIVLRRSTNAGSTWTTIRQVQYTYYAGEAHGNTGDLKLAKIQDGSGNTLDTTYLRYYTGESGGYTHGLKYVFRPDSYARLVAALGSNIDSISDTNAAPYADDYFEYDASQRITKHTVAGAGGTTGGGNGLGAYTYSYTASSNPVDYNSWATKTIETLPDGNQNIVYTNAYGEIMLRVYHDAGSGLNWEWFTKYDGSGRAILLAMPSALTGYDDTKADLLNSVSGNYQYMSDTAGLVADIDYGTSTTATSTAAGDVLGYYKDAKIQQGELGSTITLRADNYFLRSATSGTVYPLANDTLYANTDGTGARTTSYGYTWYGVSLMTKELDVTLPVVASGSNGPGSADVIALFNDSYGRLEWRKDADGRLFYTAYDQATGAVTKQIVDVNTANTGDFTDLPSGWASGSNPLHLITQMQVDGLGRTTKLTDPVGNVTYAVYLDTNYEQRVYPGWQSGSNTTTGPTQDYRYDRPGSYSETLTMSAAPHVTGGAPDGTEAIANVQSLSRAVTNSAGQLAFRDAYFNMSGITYGTSVTLGVSETNYYRTTLDYDSRGRQYRTLTPTGTYYKTFFDGLDRPVSKWIGTNDGAPGNMTQTTSYVYDGSQGAVSQTTGVGDGNLTQMTEFPGGSAANRVTNLWYDWRDRQVASKPGVQSSEDTTTHRPIIFTTFDNLNEATKVQRFDGDGTTLTISGGVPQAPASSLLRAETDYSFDSQGRVYQVQVGQVDPVNGGNPTTFLTTNYWRNHRGLLVKTAAAGGLVTKQAYDGAGRVTTQYQTDGNGDLSWTDAQGVGSNNVLTQVEPGYDSDGNVIQVVTRQRFDDETTTGALGNATTAPKARVSYVANYYDAANRLVTTADYGTNGAAAWTRPSTPDARSDAVLRTDTSYAGDSVQQVQLTGNPTGGTFTLTFNGQTTSALAYNASAATVQSALQALSSIGGGNALVASGTSGGWVVRFAGSLAGSPEPALTGNGSGLTGGTNPSVAITVTSLGGDAGRVQQVTDPRGLVSKLDYNWLGRTIRTVENFSAFAPSNSADKTTEFTYDGMNHTLTIQADLTGGAYQRTGYVYSITTSGGSGLNSNDILSATQFPDPSTGNPSSSQQESYTVNALSQQITMTDRNGNVHTYTLDLLGRQTSDTITTLGSGVDAAVRRIDTAYDGQGNPYLFTSYSDTGGATIVNQVQRKFNGYGQLIQEWQAHGGAVNISSTPSVQYSYGVINQGPNPNMNQSRLSSITYPDGRTINYNYANGIADTISRLSSISETVNMVTTTLESYSYLGLDTVVKRAHPQPNVDLTYIDPTGSTGDAGDKYTGLDRFGRVVDQRWLVTGSTSNYTDRFQYTYDRDGNRLSRTNAVNTSFNETYSYDNLNQLTSFARGTHTINWSLDPVGNFSSTTTDGGAAVNRTHNKQNEVTQVGTANLMFDSNGNMTTDETGKTLVYDAWNRLVAYKNGATALASYKYDALGRKIIENPGTQNDLYYSDKWQVLEERSGGVSTATIQYVWSPVYVDALVLRDRSTLNNGTLDERLYVQQDANWNVTALINTAGSVVERYVYDPYGKQTVLDAGSNTRSTSSYALVTGFQGARFDTTSRLSILRRRDLSPTLGHWTRIDPLRFLPGDNNLYRADFNNPELFTDPFGLEPNQVGATPLDYFIMLVHCLELAHPDASQEEILQMLEAQLKEADDWRYLYSAQYRWIDVQHFVTMIRLHWLGDFRPFAGMLYEYYQLLHFYGPTNSPSASGSGRGTYHSAFTSEDIRSNNLGVQFDRQWDRSLALSHALKVYLESIKVTNTPQAAPDFAALPLDEDDFQNNDPAYMPILRGTINTINFLGMVQAVGSAAYNR
jgi:RHS repeat-associated protein